EDQFHRAYPRATELFELKRRIDPGFRFRNVLWDKYYAPAETCRSSQETSRVDESNQELLSSSASASSPVSSSSISSSSPPSSSPCLSASSSECEFHRVYSNVKAHDAFYRFLQNIFHLYPEDRFHTLIKQASASMNDDEQIYRRLQEQLPTIKPFLADLT